MRLLTNTAILCALGAFLAPTPLHASLSTKLRGHDAVLPAASPATTRRLKKPVDDTTCVSTTLVEVEHSDPSIEESYLSCESADGNSLKVKNLSKNFIDKNKQAVAEGESLLELPAGAMINTEDSSIELPSEDDVKVKENNGNNGKKNGQSFTDDGRRLLVSGDRSVLVVRVQHATQASTTATVERLSDSVFGNGADGSVDTVTLKSQYAACSYNQLNFVEATDRDGATGTLIRNGAVTVPVSQTAVATGNDGAMRTEINNFLSAEFGVTAQNLATHVMYCLPPGTMSGIAYAGVNSWYSVYSDNWCTYLSGQMHEIGHNLGLAHANEAGTYKDQSGMMGYSYSNDNGPLMCFNSAKSYQLGWYASRYATYNFSFGSSTYRLIGLADHQNGNALASDRVVIKLNTASSTDYYMSFNRQTGINSGTQEAGNQVLIQRAGGEGASYAESELLAKLVNGATFTLDNFDGSGYAVTVTVNNINTGASPGYADVTISAGCSSNAECDDGLACNGLEVCDFGTRECVTQPGTVLSGCCGNDICEAGESPITCPGDCNFDCGAQCKTLTTTFAGGNGSQGNFFKIQALQDLFVTGFTINTSASGTGTVKVYAKDGDYVGFEANPAAWTLIYDKSVNSPGGETDIGKLDLALLVPANAFKSFHVWTSLGVRYTNGSSEGNVYASNPGEIIFFEGKGAGGEFGGTFSPRVWNGRIEYGFDNGPAPTPPPVTANPTPNPTTANPTANPTTANPTTAQPTNAPSTANPTTANPTANPTTANPTANPTTANPTTANPTANPTTAQPTANPTPAPTPSPTNEPTPAPTNPPTPAPTNFPTVTFTCSSVSSKGDCELYPTLCEWIGNPKSGSCNDLGGAGPPPPPPTPPPTNGGGGGGGCTSYGDSSSCKDNGCSWSGKDKSCS